MKITREDMPDRQVTLIMEFEGQEIEPALDKTYRKLVQKVNVPGFRRGKAPRRIFESFVGHEALVQEAAQEFVPDAVKDAIGTEGLETAEVADMDIESAEPLRVRVLLDLDSLVELGEYGDLRVEREPVEVTEQKVDSLIRNLRSREAEWQDVEEPRPAQLHDRVTVNMETYTIDGPVANMTGEDIVFQLSDETGPSWPKEIDQNITGMMPGDEKDFAITFPAEYSDEELRGREATVHAKLKSLQEQELPEMTEELVGKLSGGDLKTEEELRERVRTNMQVREEGEAKQKQVDSAIAGLVERSNIELAKAEIDHEVEHQYEHFVEGLRERRITPSRYFSYFGSSEGEWRKAEREKTITRLRELLVLREFARRESIAVEDNDIEGEIDARLAELGEAGQEDRTRELLNSEEQRRQIANRVFERKLTDRLLDIVEGRREAAPPLQDDEASATTEDGAEADSGAEADTINAEASADNSEADATATPTAEADSATTTEAETAATFTPTEISGAVPADQQGPSALEEAGGAAEVLGVGAKEQDDK